MVITGERIVAEGDDVWVQWRLVGTHQGEMNGITPTGNAIEITGVSILTINDGKIVEQWSAYDFLTFLVQAWALAAPGP